MSLPGIATMIGPSMFAGAFAFSIGAAAGWHFPGTAYALAALRLAAAAPLAVHATRQRSAPA